LSDAVAGDWKWLIRRRELALPPDTRQIFEPFARRTIGGKRCAAPP